MALHDAFLGSLAADALAMPGHWYYDRDALSRDYGVLDQYVSPRNPHSDSILWRSKYEPLNEKADILHDQAQYWGQRDIHYHQFLEAGENTLNLQLAVKLHSFVRKRGEYDAESWAIRYATCMRTPGWHRDTYVEEYHRGFFTRLAGGKSLLNCGVIDEHIGGLAQIPALLAALPSGHDGRRITEEHLALTHRHPKVRGAAICFVRLLRQIESGTPIRDALAEHARDWFSSTRARKWSIRPDRNIIGRVLSPACYIEQAFPAALYLAWKYHDNFETGIIANAMVGGDNCHRGVVVGALLGAANGVPDPWVQGLRCIDRIESARIGA